MNIFLYNLKSFNIVFALDPSKIVVKMLWYT